MKLSARFSTICVTTFTMRMRPSVPAFVKCSHPDEAENQCDGKLDGDSQHDADGKGSDFSRILIGLCHRDVEIYARNCRDEIAVKGVPFVYFTCEESVVFGEVNQHFELIRRIVRPAKPVASFCHAVGAFIVTGIGLFPEPGAVMSTTSCLFFQSV